MADLISVGWGQPNPSIATHGWKPGSLPSDNVIENILDCRTGNTPLIRVRMFVGTAKETMVLWDKILSVGNISRKMNYLTNKVAMGSTNIVLDNTNFDFSDNQKFSRTFFDADGGFQAAFKYFMQQCDVEFGLDFINRDKDKFWFNLFSGFVTQKSDNADNRTVSFSLGDETKKINDFKLNESRPGDEVLSFDDPTTEYDKQFSIGHYYGRFEFLKNEAENKDGQILIPCAFVDDTTKGPLLASAGAAKVSGTITGVGSDKLKLIDSLALFITLGTTTADIVYIEGSNRFLKILSIDSETQLTLDRVDHQAGDKYQVRNAFDTTFVQAVFYPLSNAPIKTTGSRVYLWLWKDFTIGAGNKKGWAELITNSPTEEIRFTQLSSDFVQIIYSGSVVDSMKLVPENGEATFVLPWRGTGGYLDSADKDFEPIAGLAQTTIETNPVKQLFDFCNARVGIPKDEFDIDPGLTFPTGNEKSWDKSANFISSFGAKTVFRSDKKEDGTGLDFINAVSEICRGNFFITKGIGSGSTSRIKFRMQIPSSISLVKLDETRIRNLKIKKSIAEVRNIINTNNFEYNLTSAKIDQNKSGTFTDVESINKYGKKALNIGGKAKGGLAFLYDSISYARQLSSLYVDQFKEPPAFVSFSSSPLGKINETAGELLLNLSDFVEIDSPGLQVGPNSDNDLSGIFQIFSETFSISKFEFSYQGLWAGNLLSIDYDKNKQFGYVGRKAIALETAPIWTVTITGSAVLRTAGDSFLLTSEWVGRELIFNGVDKAKIIAVTDGNNLVIDKSLSLVGVSMDFTVKYYLF